MHRDGEATADAGADANAGAGAGGGQVVNVADKRFPPVPLELVHVRLATDGGASPNAGTGAPVDRSGCGMVCLAPPAGGGNRSIAG